jgi:hypothetical protein
MHCGEVDLTDERLRWLRQACVDDGIPITARFRALLVLAMRQPELTVRAVGQARADELARKG